jgi:ParB family chromosome partitioning protein
MNRNDNPRKALGKGISALVPTKPLHTAPPEPAREEPELPTSVRADLIDANPLQPRRNFEPDALKELAQSIKINGIIQPLVVRKAHDRYQLVAGERRWRAAQQAGLTQVPVVIRDIPDDRLLEITLIENIQREDLNPIETATAFARMAKELGLSPDEIGRRTGKDRTTIINLTRLLQLPADLQQMLIEGRLSAGHARSLLALPNMDLQREVARKVVLRGWSVRETERITQKLLTERDGKPVEEVKEDPNVRAAIQEMQRILGTRVRIVEGARKKGKIEIEYYSQEDLDRIYSVIVGGQ